MTQKAHIEIGKRHFQVPRWAIAVVAILVMAAPALWVVQEFRSSLEDYADETQAETLGTSVAGCERNNGLRTSAFSNSVLDALTREAAASQYTAGAKDSILTYAEQNWQDAQQVVDAASEFPSKTWPETADEKKLDALARPGLADPGPPTVDCEAAFSAAQAAQAALTSGNPSE